MGVRTKSRVAAAGIAFASVAAAGAVMAAPANAALTEDLQVDNSALLGSVGETRYGVGCGYGVIATTDEVDSNVQFKVTGPVPSTQTVKANGNKAVFNWFPLAPGNYTITATQGNTKTTGQLTVSQAIYTGSSCILL